MVDAILEAAKANPDYSLTQTKAEDVVLGIICAFLLRFVLTRPLHRYQMFEVNMDEYLDEEVESVKQSLDVVCRGWDRQVMSSYCGNTDAYNSSQHAERLASSAPSNTARFLGSHNPAQVKRNLLASFTDVLLLPVTIVPRTVNAVGGAIITGGTAAAQGIAMLNPQRWAGNASAMGNGYSKKLEGDGEMLFDNADLDDDETLVEKEKPQLDLDQGLESHAHLQLGC